jgi:hypothetical protein
MRSFFEKLPKDRLLQGDEDVYTTALRGQDEERNYAISSSGARLTYPYAIEVLDRFSHSLVRKPTHCHSNSLLIRSLILAIRERMCHKCFLLCDSQRQEIPV